MQTKTLIRLHGNTKSLAGVREVDGSNCWVSGHRDAFGTAEIRGLLPHQSLNEI
jgi:hypothetical protein